MVFTSANVATDVDRDWGAFMGDTHWREFSGLIRRRLNARSRGDLTRAEPPCGSVRESQTPRFHSTTGNRHVAAATRRYRFTNSEKRHAREPWRPPSPADCLAGRGSFDPRQAETPELRRRPLPDPVGNHRLRVHSLTRRFKEFWHAAGSWSRVEGIIARVEVGAEGPDTRFIVTNLATRDPRVLYQDVYCRRGRAENHIKSWKTHLAADRTSCSKATANQFRLFLHAGAY